MAGGDWVKARVDLRDDPRTLTMAAQLVANPRFVEWMGVSRDGPVAVAVTVLGLLGTWGTLRRQGHADGDDLVVAHCSAETLDALTGVPGFGASMVRVEWAVPQEDGSMRFPRFLRENATHDGIAREKEADRKRRYRARLAAERAARAASTAADTGTRSPPTDASRDSPGTTSDRREEKRREEREHTQKEDAAAGAAAASAPPGPELFTVANGATTAPAGSSSDYVQFVAWWEGEYRSVLETPYKASWKKDGPALRELLQMFPLEELKVRAVRWLTTDQKWIADTDRALYLFAAKINMRALLGTKPRAGRRDVERGAPEPAPESSFQPGSRRVV